MKRTFVFLGLSVILAIATLAQGTSFSNYKVDNSCHRGQCGQSRCTAACTDACRQSK